MGIGGLSVSGFDPWAALAEIRGCDPAPSDGSAISRNSRISREATPQAENENAAPARFDWPDCVDYWLTHDAVRLAGILNLGGTARVCPNGGLDVWREDGRYLGISADLAGRLRLARLLPESL